MAILKNFLYLMTIFNRAERLMIFVGDLAVFALSLWISLFIRNGILPTLDEYKFTLFHSQYYLLLGL
jgi:hypothetical protein